MVTARIPVRVLAARRKGSWRLVDIGHCFQNLAKPCSTATGPELLRAAQYARAKRQTKWSRISMGNRWFPVWSAVATQRNHPAVNDTAAASPSHRFID
jgi:tRNA A37 N6-isopentenylltransferase MiaA